jgi:Universal stress protein family
MLKNVAVGCAGTVTQSGEDVPELRRRSQRTRRIRPALSGPLLVDAGEPSVAEGALRLAAVLARRNGVKAQVLTAVPPLPSLLSLGAPLAADLGRHELDECRREMARKRTRALVSETVGPSSFFRTSAVLGRPVREVGAAARAAAASYVLSGLASAETPARQRAVDRLSRLATAAGVPVLAVPADATLLPRSALAAIDLREASIAAARAAVPLLAREASLTLLHVLPAVESDPSKGQGSVEVGIQGARDALRRLAAEIHALSDIPVHVVVVEGEPASMVSQWQSRFDLVTLGGSRGGQESIDGSASVLTAASRVARGAVLISAPDRRRVHASATWHEPDSV